MPASRKKIAEHGRSPKAERKPLRVANPKSRTEAAIDSRRPRSTPPPTAAPSSRRRPAVAIAHPHPSEASPRDRRDAGDRERFENIPWSKVKTARARIAADYYERGEVKGRVLDALMDELLRP